jgi:aryl-alcohol dehydrogenase-like predicted oxidoreductase
MKLRPLGRTGLEVSLVGLGTMTWGEQNTEPQAHEQLDHAVAQGVNFVDVAEMYPVPPKAETQGRTEQYLGSWLKARGNRGKVIVATKATGPADFPWLRGGPRQSRAHLREALEGSLKRLQTDYVDLYQVHWPDRSTNFFGKLGYSHSDDPGAIPLEETLAALHELVRAGKVRHVGISNETPWGLAEYLRLARERGWPRVASIQNPYNLLNRTFEIGLAEFAHREQVGLLAYSPLAFGTLSGKYLGGARPPGARLTLFSRFQRYTGERVEAAVRAYVELARAHGLDPAQMALAYAFSRPFMTSVLVAGTTLAQLRANIAAAELKLSTDVVAGIEKIHRDHPNPAP